MNDQINSPTVQITGPMHFIMQQPTQQHDSSELNLSKLFSKIKAKSTLIMSITGICVIVAGIITLIVPSEYQTQTTLSAPNEAQTHTLYLNTDRQLTSNELFLEFTKKLSHRGNIINFLKNSGLFAKALEEAKNPASEKEKISILNKLILQFQITFIHHRADDLRDNFKDNSQEVVLTTLSPHFDLDAKKSKAYITYTNQQVLSDLINEQRAIATQRIKKMEQQIKAAVAKEKMSRSLLVKRLENEQSLKLAKINTRITALNQRDIREHQIELDELKTAYDTAKSLGITNPINAIVQQGGNRNSARRDDLYRRGTSYLKNTIALTQKRRHTLSYDKKIALLQEKLDIIKNDQTILALKSRKDDKPYIKNIKNKQLELERLKLLSFNVGDFKAYRVDGIPYMETSPVRPKKLKYIIVGFLVGVLLSCLIVFVESFIRTISRPSLKVTCV